MSRLRAPVCQGGVQALSIPPIDIQALEKLIDREDLGFEACRGLLHELIEQPEPTQLAAFLVLLRAKASGCGNLLLVWAV